MGTFIGVRNSRSWFHFDGDSGARSLSPKELSGEVKNLGTKHVDYPVEIPNIAMDVPASVEWFNRVITMDIDGALQIKTIANMARMASGRPTSILYHSDIVNKGSLDCQTTTNCGAEEISP